MTILPYVYKLVHKETLQFYYGSRLANIQQSNIDLPIYKSSSEHVKKLGFENFNWEIIAEFFNGTDAWWYEQQLIKESFKNSLCLNRFYVDPNNGKKMFSMYGKRHSSKSREKIIASNKGKKRSAEVCMNMSCGQKNMTDESRIQLLGNLTRKTWVVTNEKDHCSQLITNLKIFCINMEINYRSLRNTLRTNNFYNGLKLSYYNNDNISYGESK